MKEIDIIILFILQRMVCIKYYYWINFWFCTLYYVSTYRGERSYHILILSDKVDEGGGSEIL